jgi:hypothetical protein
MRKMRARLAAPEIIEEDQTMEVLRRNGYAVDTAGNIEPYRRHPSDALVSWDRGTPSRSLRYGHQHLAVIRIDTSESKLIDAVVAAVDEPCLVGTNDAGAVLVFRVGPSYAVGGSLQAAEEFVTADGKPGLFTTADTSPLDVAAFTWRNERSPLNTPLMLLPPMYVDITQAASGAVGVFLRENGGRWGPAVLPESPMERLLREQAARGPAVEITPEEADEKLVAANPNLRPTDGTLGIRVSQARARIADRKQEAQSAEKTQKAQRDKATLKGLLEKSA